MRSDLFCKPGSQSLERAACWLLKGQLALWRYRMWNVNNQSVLRDVTFLVNTF